MGDPSSFPKGDTSGFVSKDVDGAKSLISRKRKNSTLGSKSKRLRIEKEDLIELKITWEEAQGLLRPPPNHAPTVVVIEGFEFEEYEVQMKISFLFFLKGLHGHVFIVFFTHIFFYRLYQCSMILDGDNQNLVVCYFILTSKTQNNKFEMSHESFF